MATLSSLTEIVPSEYIERPMRTANLAALAALLIADARPVPPGSGSTVAIPYPEADAVPAGTKTENAEFDLTTTSMAEATVTAGTVGYSEEISRELTGEALYGAVETAVENKVAHLRDRIESDIFSLFSSLSQQSGTTNTDLTEAIVIGAVFAHAAQNPQPTPGGLALALSPVMLQNWTTDVGTNGGAWTQGPVESERIASLVTSGSGFRGTRLGLSIFMSTNVPTSGGDAIGGIVGMGDRSCLAYRVWRPIEFESRYLPRQQCWEITISARYGTAIVRQADGRGLIADN